MKITQISIESRRSFLKTSLLLGVGSIGLVGCATFGLPRISKASAGYKEKGSGKSHCDDCVHFSAPHTCSIVSGNVDTKGVCHYFLHK